MAQGTEPKTHLGEGNMKAQLLWKSTASFDSKCSPLTATTPASSFERKCSICMKEKTNQVMEKKMKGGGYRLWSTQGNCRERKK